MHPTHQLQRDIGQLLWLGFDGTQVPASLAAAIGRAEVGAVILFRRNLPVVRRPEDGSPIVDMDALARLTAALHQAASPQDPPLWIAVDQEGGRVQRVREPATVWPPMLAFEALGDDRSAVALAEEVGLAMGRELAALGFDIDFAPVLDVHTNPANPIIGDRAFGTAAQTVAARALAWARGLHRAGMVACGKHFPGHGDTSTDSHLELPRLAHDRQRLEAIELVPFRRAAAAGIPLIMTAHVVFAAIEDGVPATLSQRVITGLLRQDLGFTGVVVSDDLDMKAIADHIGIGDAAVRAIMAGCDALLLCRNPQHQRQAWEALVAAGQAHGAVRTRIAQSAERIRAAKRRHLAHVAPAAAPPDRAAHRELAARLAAERTPGAAIGTRIGIPR